MSSKRNEPYAAIKKPVDLLFGSSATQPDSQPNATNTIAITKIKLPPSQPRRYFDEHKLEELSRSIKELGILEPLLVRPLSTKSDYELVAGERRYKAALMAELTEVPVVIREMDDATTYQVRLVENLQREDLNPLEETEGILELLVLRLEMARDEVVSHLNRMRNVCDRNSELRHNVMSQPQTQTIEELFGSLGRMSWESFVKNRLPLLNLPHNVLEVLRSGQLEYTKARAIARVKDEKIRNELLKTAIECNLSLSEIKQKIQVLEQQSESVSSSQTEQIDLKERVDETFRRFKKAKLWDDPKKKTRIEKLLAQLEALMKED
jgi:ParB family transcriptional regulator, chromosome partitioning protein